MKHTSKSFFLYQSSSTRVSQSPSIGLSRGLDLVWPGNLNEIAGNNKERFKFDVHCASHALSSLVRSSEFIICDNKRAHQINIYDAISNAWWSTNLLM